jgi:hypothetical protein
MMPTKNRKFPHPMPMPVVVTAFADSRAGNPWDAWEDRRHGAVDLGFPSCTEAALQRWEELLGRR